MRKLALLLVVLLTPVLAADYYCNTCDACQTIINNNLADGDTLHITADLSGLNSGGNACLEFSNAINVTLDCDGHRITGSGAGSGMRILNGTVTLVGDCSVSGYPTQVLVGGSGALHVQDHLDVSSTTGEGLNVQNAGHFYVAPSGSLDAHMDSGSAISVWDSLAEVRIDGSADLSGTTCVEVSRGTIEIRGKAKIHGRAEGVEVESGAVFRVYYTNADVNVSVEDGGTGINVLDGGSVDVTPGAMLRVVNQGDGTGVRVYPGQLTVDGGLVLQGAGTGTGMLAGYELGNPGATMVVIIPDRPFEISGYAVGVKMEGDPDVGLVNLHMNNVDTGILVAENGGVYRSRLQLNDAEIHVADKGISAQEALERLILDGCTVEAGSNGIVITKASTAFNTDIQITGTEITSDRAVSILDSGGGTTNLTIQDSALSGNYALSLSGSVDVDAEDSDFTGCVRYVNGSGDFTFLNSSISTAQSCSGTIGLLTVATTVYASTTGDVVFQDTNVENKDADDPIDSAVALAQGGDVAFQGGVIRAPDLGVYAYSATSFAMMGTDVRTTEKDGAGALPVETAVLVGSATTRTSADIQGAYLEGLVGIGSYTTGMTVRQTEINAGVGITVDCGSTNMSVEDTEIVSELTKDEMTALSAYSPKAVGIYSINCNLTTDGVEIVNRDVPGDYTGIDVTPGGTLNLTDTEIVCEGCSGTEGYDTRGINIRGPAAAQGGYNFHGVSARGFKYNWYLGDPSHPEDFYEVIESIGTMEDCRNGRGKIYFLDSVTGAFTVEKDASGLILKDCQMTWPSAEWGEVKGTYSHMFPAPMIVTTPGTTTECRLKLRDVRSENSWSGIAVILGGAGDWVAIDGDYIITANKYGIYVENRENPGWGEYFILSADSRGQICGNEVDLYLDDEDYYYAFSEYDSPAVVITGEVDCPVCLDSIHEGTDVDEDTTVSSADNRRSCDRCSTCGAGAAKRMDVTVEASCEGVRVTAMYQNEPLKEVKVRVYAHGRRDWVVASGETGEDGTVFVPLEPGTYFYRVSKKGYKEVKGTVEIEECPKPECTQNSDCPVDKKCEDGKCVNIECACGHIENHECIKYQCCSDSDCGEGFICQEHTCVKKEEKKEQETVEKKEETEEKPEVKAGEEKEEKQPAPEEREKAPEKPVQAVQAGTVDLTLPIAGAVVGILILAYLVFFR